LTTRGATIDSEYEGQGPVNVLVTAAGRRTSLVRAFVEAAHARRRRVYAGDVDGLAPALFFADEAVPTLATDDPGYLADLIETVKRHSIGLLVPTIDTDLPILAAGRSLFGAVGCRLALSSESFVTTTLDKVSTGAAFGGANISVPRSWLPPFDETTELPAHLFVKPRRGSASKDTFRISRAELETAIRFVPDPVVQEALTGPEITIDALLDFEGRPIHFVPRIRIKTLGGESVQGVTLDHDDAVETWIERVLGVCSTLGAAGPLTIQAFLTPQGPVLLEVNPRFGGGFPLALAAGGTYPAWLLDMVAGVPVEPRLRAYDPGIYMTRHYVERFETRPKW
jgi:carbamoyl-phosphate synthase large subunit